MDVTIEQELREYFQLLSESEQKGVLRLLKRLANRQEGQAIPVTLEEYNKELAEAEAEYERGEYISHAEMLKQMKQW